MPDLQHLLRLVPLLPLVPRLLPRAAVAGVELMECPGRVADAHAVREPANRHR